MTQSDSLREISCDNCGDVKSEGLFTVGDWSIVRCTGCGLMFVNPQPAAEKLVEHYQADSHWGGEPQRAAETGSSLLYSQIRLLLSPCSRVLDIGCSFGLFMEALRKDRHTAIGIELSGRAAEEARGRGFEVFERPLDELDLGGQEFDAVTMLNVVEHFPAPRRVCEQILRLLRPGGVVVAVTPNTNFALPLVSASVALTGNPDIRTGIAPKVSQLHPPNHLYFYTPHTLTDLLRRAGFERCRVVNAIPILNASRFRTLAKWMVWSSAELFRGASGGRLVYGHSLLAYAFKPQA